MASYKITVTGLSSCASSSFYIRNDWIFYIVRFAELTENFFPFKKGLDLSVSQTYLNAYWLLSKVKGVTKHLLVEVTLRGKKILLSNIPSHCSSLYEFGE